MKDRRIISTGYNGVKPGDSGCLSGACPRGLLSYDEVAALSSYDTGPGMCISSHAENSALMYSSRREHEDGTMYITGEPCMGCRKMMSISGLARVVWPDGEYSV